MKSVAIILLVYTVGSLAVPIRLNTKFQNKLNPPYEDVDRDVIEFRISLSRVLEVALNRVSVEIDENGRKIQNLEAPVREAVEELSDGECAINLQELLESLTGFTGYQSSNCATAYEGLVNDGVRQADNMIDTYYDNFKEYQILKVFN